MTPWRISVDVGGTFTDAVGVSPEGRTGLAKVLSVGAARVRIDATKGPTLSLGEPGAAEALGPLAGAAIRRIGSDDVGTIRRIDPAASTIEVDSHKRASPGVYEIRTGEPAPILAARLLTGAPHGSPLPACDFRLATTRATNALLAGDYGRVALITSEGFKDLLRIGDQRRPDLFALDIRKPEPLTDLVFGVPGRMTRDGAPLVELDEASVHAALDLAGERGVDSIAVALMHAWANDAQEQRVAALARARGFGVVRTSAEVASRLGLLARAQAVTLQAALSPVLDDYLDRVTGALPDSTVRVMTSSGGLIERERFSPIDSLLSGPAGGVRAAARLGARHGIRQLISFDMGGTSTDVARIDGEPALRPTHRVGPVTLARPAVAIETVAAGGGSICGVRDGRPVVGPESAGADPGPACYGAGGPLTITDVNLLLGRVDHGCFEIPVSIEAARRAFRAFASQLPQSGADDEALLNGLLDLANERVAEAIRGVSVRQGYDPADHALVAFGGAGPQHACEVAQRLGVSTVVVPIGASLLSAVGVAAAPLDRTIERVVLKPLDAVRSDLDAWLSEMAHEANGGRPIAPHLRRLCHASLRQRGQDTTIEIPISSVGELLDDFALAYERLHATPPNRPVELVGLRVVLRDDTAPDTRVDFPPDLRPGRPSSPTDSPRRVPRAALVPGADISGPALVLEQRTTTWVPAGWRCGALADGCLELTRSDPAPPPSHATGAFARELTIHRLTTIAEHMGEALERAAVSTNVKERRDYSCGVLDQEARLVAAAAHIPVHLGALGPCVRGVIDKLGALAPGDVCVTNHPAFGGSHLPDITVIQGSFDAVGNRLGYVASRAHHAEIGGLTPGSMPPHAESLADEGVPISPMFIARGGRACLDDLRDLLTGHRYPTRAIDDNLADLGAAMAAGRRAAIDVAALAQHSGRHAVEEAAAWLIAHTERLTMEAIDRLGAPAASAVERMDDGAEIRVEISRSGRRLRVDFTGTSEMRRGNTNAPLAVTRSAVAYVVRLLVDRPLPLNDGLLAPIDLIVPEGCLLNATFDGDDDRSPPVAGGNVETSQRVVEALLAALGLCAGGPGTMNNTLFGNDRFSVYETIGGGAGATPRGPGADGVHVHMTNTSITDPEALEQRHPLRVRRFELRDGSGGEGRHRGGRGLVREIEALEPMHLTVLTQRRDAGAPGTAGGRDGQPGAQRVITAAGDATTLAWADGADLEAHDRVVIEAPGGGGFGSPA